MTSKTTETVAIHVRTFSEYGYDFTTIWILTGKLTALSGLIEECVDNKAGYGGGQEVADRVSARLQGLCAAGYVHSFDTGHRSWSITAKYQHYKTDVCTFCEPEVSLGTRADEILHALPAFNRLIRPRTPGGCRRFPKSPAELLARFPKAIRVELVGNDYVQIIDPDHV